MKGCRIRVITTIINKYSEKTPPEWLSIARDASAAFEHILPHVFDFTEQAISVDMTFLTSEQMRELNAEQRGVDAVTDVLSFPSFQWKEGVICEDLSFWQSEEPLLLGDLVFAPDRVTEQAHELEHDFERELFFLILHGLLHLVGYDHVEPEEEANMIALQKKMMALYKTEPEKEPEEKNNVACGFVALIGRPNVGKSTLLNAVSGMTLAITSPKPQTTRDLIRSVYNDASAQIIFLDTPGLHKPDSGLGRAMMKAAYTGVRQADIVLLMIEATFKPFIGNLEKRILRMADEDKTPVILIINKVDVVAKEALLPLMAAFHAAYSFAAIVPISAAREDGIDLLLEEIKKRLPRRSRLFERDDETNQTERQLAAELIRREILMQCQKEVPYGVAVEIETFEDLSFEPTRETAISAVIYCEKSSHKRILVGKNGTMIKHIGMASRAAIAEMLGGRVHLNLFVKVRDNWKNKNIDLRDLGFSLNKPEIT